MKLFRLTLLSTLVIGVSLIIAGCSSASGTSSIPLPEHPRPDFERADFINLNGLWKFTFNETLAKEGLQSYDKEILVPFPWGSKLSQVKDEGDIAWYGREIKVPSSWKGKRVFLVVGASDWETTVSVDGKVLGTHKGGYTPFEFEITDLVDYKGGNTLSLKVDDTYSASHLYGKQGYGNARGIWQTPYLETRGERYISGIHFSPDIDNEKVGVEVKLDAPAAEGTSVKIDFKNKEYKTVTVPAASDVVKFDIDLPGQHLWDIDDPYLYEVTASLTDGKNTIDEVNTYFGQRKVSAMRVPGKDYKYIALNNKPLYMQLCLDQSYHPEGFYTFPSDEFMKNEIMISKNVGLNGNRIHIKVEVPRKLYWADKLGLLIMADVPNFWGEPTPEAKEDWEHCMREQVKRDYNHPSIFAWVDFNETWGLFSSVDKVYDGNGRVRGNRAYLPETQDWVRDMYNLNKTLDPTRLVEDNSACNHDHVVTDIDSWHSYNVGHMWEAQAAFYDQNCVVGGTFNYIGGNTMEDVPMINSECGNVWGYRGSAGDSDFSWDYHCMMNAFHRHLHIGGWLYTEHHDVINEWNGYVKYDRSRKIDGLDAFIPEMGIKDFHTLYYIVPEGDLCQTVPAGSTQVAKLFTSFTTDKDPGAMTLETVFTGIDPLGETHEYSRETDPVAFKAFDLVPAVEKKLQIPAENGVYTLSYVLKDKAGNVLSRNFSLYVVKDAPEKDNIISFPANSFTAQEWSLIQLNVLDGLKVNGFGSGWFEYTVDIPENVDAAGKDAELVFEASAKELFGKDKTKELAEEGDAMLGKGNYDSHKSPNSYAMTDEVLWPSCVEVTVNGKNLGKVDLPDDPADHRGVLSWNSQPKERLMFEGGSYGYLVRVRIPAGTLEKGKPATIRLTVPESAATGKGGGLAIYGKDFGRYVLDPSIIF